MSRTFTGSFTAAGQSQVFDQEEIGDATGVSFGCEGTMSASGVVLQGNYANQSQGWVAIAGTDTVGSVPNTSSPSTELGGGPRFIRIFANGTFTGSVDWTVYFPFANGGRTGG